VKQIPCADAARRAPWRDAAMWVLALALLATAAAAHAQGLPPDPINKLNQFAIWIAGIAFGIASIFGVTAAVKFSAGRADWSSMTPPMIGGVVIGAIAAFAAWATA
jgi:hypothetical protein